MITRFLIVSLCCAPLSHGAVTTIFRDIKRHLQQGPESADFVLGALDLDVRDGMFTDAGCGLSPTRYFPSLFCPPGSQGLIAGGDVTGPDGVPDGIPDDGAFSSITSVTAATQLEPFRTDRVKILAAPPSGIADILRKSDGDVADVFAVIDTSAVIWWDMLNFPIEQYELSGFTGVRVYSSGEAELERQYHDLPWGNYLFSYPRLDDPQNPHDDELQIEFGVTVTTTPDIYPGRGRIDQGWRVGGPDDVWVTYDPPIGTFSFLPEDPVDVTGALEVDPKSFSEIRWTGINLSNTLLGDELFFSIVGDYPTSAFDPFTGECVPTGGPDQFGIVFPPYSPCASEASRQEILIDTFDGQVNMPPFWFLPGEFVFAHLRFVRDLPAGFQTFDGSERSIYVPISFVETWDTFALFSQGVTRGGFPFGTPTSERTQKGDFDGDGVNNFYEFALNTDVNDDTDFPAIVANETVPQGTGVGECGGELIKRAYLSSVIEFEYQHSPNGVNWFAIDEDDPDWLITTSDVTIPDGDPDGDVTERVVVQNEVVLPGAECFFRVVITD